MIFGKNLQEVESLYGDAVLHYIDDLGQNYIALWYDDVQHEDRHLVFTITYQNLLRLKSDSIEHAITLRQTIMAADKVFMVNSSEIKPRTPHFDGMRLDPKTLEPKLPGTQSYVNFKVYIASQLEKQKSNIIRRHQTPPGLH
jgi:hypothetical protein